MKPDENDRTSPIRTHAYCDYGNPGLPVKQSDSFDSDQQVIDAVEDVQHIIWIDLSTHKPGNNFQQL